MVARQGLAGNLTKGNDSIISNSPVQGESAAVVKRCAVLVEEANDEGESAVQGELEWPRDDFD